MKKYKRKNKRKYFKVDKVVTIDNEWLSAYLTISRNI